jgi:transcription elongation factor Elf1
MKKVKCPNCMSLNVTVVSTDEAQEMVTIQCFACGQESEIDNADFHVDTGDLPDSE